VHAQSPRKHVESQPGDELLKMDARFIERVERAIVAGKKSTAINGANASRLRLGRRLPPGQSIVTD
jgi:hypothetical protein